jgi:hypothetical protein
MAQRAHAAQMVLKLIRKRTNTFLRFQVSRYVLFFYTEEPEMSRFLHSIYLVTLANLARDDSSRLRKTPPLVGLLVGWMQS